MQCTAVRSIGRDLIGRFKNEGLILAPLKEGESGEVDDTIAQRLINTGLLVPVKDHPAAGTVAKATQDVKDYKAKTAPKGKDDE